MNLIESHIRSLSLSVANEVALPTAGLPPLRFRADTGSFWDLLLGVPSPEAFSRNSFSAGASAILGSPWLFVGAGAAAALAHFLARRRLGPVSSLFLALGAAVAWVVGSAEVWVVGWQMPPQMLRLVSLSYRVVIVATIVVALAAALRPSRLTGTGRLRDWLSGIPIQFWLIYCLLASLAAIVWPIYMTFGMMFGATGGPRYDLAFWSVAPFPVFCLVCIPASIAKWNRTKSLARGAAWAILPLVSLLGLLLAKFM